MVRSMPTGHVRTSRRILEWAYRPLLDPEIVEGTPFVFKQGISDIACQVTFLKRVLSYLPIAFMKDTEDFHELLKEIDPIILFYAKSGIEIPRILRAGIERYLAVGHAEKVALNEDINLAVRTITKHLDQIADRASVSENDPGTSMHSGEHDGFALFAFNSKQAKLMAELAANLAAKELPTTLISFETMTGDQGVENLWDKMGLTYTTYNGFMLHGEKFDRQTKIVMQPYDGITSKLIANGKGRVIEINDLEAPIELPDDNKPANPDIRVDISSALGTLNHILSDSIHVVEERSQKEGASSELLTAPYAFTNDEPLHLTPDAEKLIAFKDRYKGERCFIIGNGPSLNKHDLTKLRNEYTFAVNGIFYKKDEMGFDPTFYIVEDSSVMKENLDAIINYSAQNKFFPTIYRKLTDGRANDANFFLMNRGFYERTSPFFCIPRFSTDAARRVFCGQSVTHINLQLAYYFGFSKVYLIGMDFSYSIPKSAIVKGDLIISTEDDVNHFHSSYFGAGKSWKDPKLHRVKQNYQVARDVFTADGREIFNASIGGKLDVFRRVNYDKLV
ncbi:DUF115 domain-containing protein [Mesorhizobium sp. DCY119]|nr:DUF115 domain-containing protein [Mesorhizobium sp. DCY119]